MKFTDTALLIAMMLPTIVRADTTVINRSSEPVTLITTCQNQPPVMNTITVGGKQTITTGWVEFVNSSSGSISIQRTGGKPIPITPECYKFLYLVLHGGISGKGEGTPFGMISTNSPQ